MEDHVILDMFFQRQEPAITETRYKYGRRLLKTAVNILQSNEDAEECVIDTLLKARKAIPPTAPRNSAPFYSKLPEICLLINGKQGGPPNAAARSACS